MVKNLSANFRVRIGTREATAMRSLLASTGEKPMQQRRPRTAKNKHIINYLLKDEPPTRLTCVNCSLRNAGFNTKSIDLEPNPSPVSASRMTLDCSIHKKAVRISTP